MKKLKTVLRWVWDWGTTIGIALFILVLADTEVDKVRAIRELTKVQASVDKHLEGIETRMAQIADQNARMEALADQPVKKAK